MLLDGHIDVPADRLAAVEAGLAEHVRLTHAEPGCLFFSVTPCGDIAGRFIVSEIFADEAAFAAHQARGAASPWAEVTKDIPRQYEIRTA
ncbi:MAG: antibiotic biosynthesis monooxygenase [Ahrensia sp.]|nr:antibiotic biosynthesis monooxygenase [Ahrensia sp.]